jgi:hypothetical protein
LITDTEIKIEGVQILSQYLGDVEAERFVALIQREPFDYTEWHQQQNEPQTIEGISRSAMTLRENNAR